MKKIGLMVVAVALSLSVAAFAAEQPKGQKSPSKGKTVSKDQGQSAKTLAEEIAQIKQQHQAEINELQEIKRLATEEKAPKTVEALNKVIGRRNLEFEKTIGPKQEKLNALQNPSSNKTTRTAPKKGPPK